MDYTVKLSLPELATSQETKEIVHNEALWILDALVQATVIDKDLTAPPASPTSGDCYIVGASATGDWAGHDGDFTQYRDSYWVFYEPEEGWEAYVADEDTKYIADGAGSWEVEPGGGTELAEANEWTKTQNFDATTLTDAASITWDLESNQVCSVTLTDSRALANPTNMVDGATYVLFVKQDATGSRTLSFGTAYKWPGGTAPTLTTDASAVDILTFVCDGSSMFGVFQGDFK